MASNKQQKDLRSIYELLDKLCRKFSPDRHKDILKTVTTTIADSQQGFLSNLQFDESIIVNKVISILSASYKECATSTVIHRRSVIFR